MIQLSNAARRHGCINTCAVDTSGLDGEGSSLPKEAPHCKFFYAAKEGLKSRGAAFFHVRSGVRRRNIRAIRLFMCASVGSGAFRL